MVSTLAPAFVPGLPGGPELLIVLAVLVLLFGASKLPSLARSLGEAGGEFKKGREEVESELRADAEHEEPAAESSGGPAAESSSDSAAE